MELIFGLLVLLGGLIVVGIVVGFVGFWIVAGVCALAAGISELTGGSYNEFERGGSARIACCITAAIVIIVAVTLFLSVAG